MDVLNKKIQTFLDTNHDYGDSTVFGDGSGNSIGFGAGNGFGTGFGYGHDTSRFSSIDNGYGNGCGLGNGYSHGCGNGCGYGENNSHGNGNGIKEYEGYLVYDIDRIPTIIKSLHGNIAQGFISKHNRFTVPCYVVRVGNYFAHGFTAKEALRDAQAKYEHNKPIKERIEDFMDIYPSLDSTVQNSDLYIWHNVLTGSCAFGRQQFAKRHEIDINNGSMSVKEFIILTQNSYRGEIIKQLYAAYGTSLK